MHIAGARLPKPGRYLIAAVEKDFVLPRGVDLPTSVDLSAYFPPPGDQGIQASCTAWALGYGLATFRDNWARQMKPDPKSPPDPHELYSPGFLFNMVKQYAQPDSSVDACRYGVDIGATFTIACEWGNCTWAEYPYDSEDTGCEQHVDRITIDQAVDHKLPKAVALWRTNTGFGPDVVPFDPVQWKYHVARNEPVVACFSIDCSFTQGGEEAWRDHVPFTWDVTSANDTDACSGGHAMVCTGYDDADSSFTFLNSFGQQWGSAGRVKLTYRTLQSIVTREAYIFSHQWWTITSVPAGKPAEEEPVLDSTLSGRIKPGQVHRFHDLEVRVAAMAPHSAGILLQFTDTAATRPVMTLDFPVGVERSFMYEDQLWSFMWTKAGLLRRLFSKAVRFTLGVDEDDDEKLEEAMERHFAPWRRGEER